MGGGAPSPASVCGSSRHEGRSFAPGYSARAVQRHRPTAVAASDRRVGASPASGVATGWWLSGSFVRGVLASPRSWGRKGCRGLQLSRSFLERGRLPPPKEGGSKQRAARGGMPKAAPRVRKESGVRGCVRASYLNRCRSRQAAAGSREARTGVPRDERGRAMHGDGDLARSNLGRRQKRHTRSCGRRGAGSRIVAEHLT